MAVSLAACVCCAPSLFAQTSPVSDWMKVWDGSGQLVTSITVTEADEIRNGPGFIYQIDNVLVPVDVSQFGNYGVLEEQPGVYSDIFGIANIGSDYHLSFSSDVDGVPFPYGPAHIVLPETGIPVDVTMYLSPALRANGWTAQFWSDTEGVPDAGATAGLLGLALMGLGLLRRSIR